MLIQNNNFKIYFVQNLNLQHLINTAFLPFFLSKKILSTEG
jgi:hypothetical protein